MDGVEQLPGAGPLWKPAPRLAARLGAAVMVEWLCIGYALCRRSGGWVQCVQSSGTAGPGVERNSDQPCCRRQPHSAHAPAGGVTATGPQPSTYTPRQLQNALMVLVGSALLGTVKQQQNKHTTPAQPSPAYLPQHVKAVVLGHVANHAHRQAGACREGDAKQEERERVRDFHSERRQEEGKTHACAQAVLQATADEA